MQVTELLEVAKEVVYALLADLDVCCDLGGTAAVGAGPAEERGVRGADVVEAGRCDAFVDTATEVVECEAQERPDLDRRAVVAFTWHR